MVKDPLGSSLSPYELLGVDLNANRAEIHSAFKKSITLKKYSPLQIANARRTLLDTESRLQEDFFLYEQEEEKEIELDYSVKKHVGIKGEITFDIIECFDKIDLEILEEIGDE